MKQPIQYVLNLILQYANAGGLDHAQGCMLRIPSTLRHSSNHPECNCGARELNLLVEGEVLKSFTDKQAMQIGEVEFRSYTGLKKQGLLKLYRRKGLPFARLTKTGAAYVRDHDVAMGLAERKPTEAERLKPSPMRGILTNQERLAAVPEKNRQWLSKRVKCEKCNAKTFYRVKIMGGRWAAWCGCP